MAKRDPDKYLGRWEETHHVPLDIPLTVDNLVTLVRAATEESSVFSHQQIAHWCARFWWEYQEGSKAENADATALAAADVAQDIEAQWDLFLLESFSLKELQSIDFSNIRLPNSWFTDWLGDLLDSDL